MKTIFKFNIVVTFLVILFAFETGFGQSTIETTDFKVYGNCSQCKKRIENSLDHKGIKLAVWNVRSKNLQVTYNSDKITLDEIHKLVADAGHDTDKVKAKDEKYASLPFCCLYRDSELDGKDHSHK